jgi:hypothetical protein
MSAPDSSSSKKTRLIENDDDPFPDTSAAPSHLAAKEYLQRTSGQPEQLALLQAVDCDKAQGFYCSPAVSREMPSDSSTRIGRLRVGSNRARKLRDPSPTQGEDQSG